MKYKYSFIIYRPRNYVIKDIINNLIQFLIDSLSKMSKIIRHITKLGPKAIGPYSSASIYNGMVFLSTQSGVDPKSGQLVGHDISSQTTRALENVKTILGELHVPLTDVIKSTVYLKVSFC